MLDLLARGRTNGQIAEELGISLDGAKWHVGEIITKLDVDTREEAAEYWRQQRGLPARLRLLTRAGFSPSALRFLAAGLGLPFRVMVAIAGSLVSNQDEPEVVHDPATAVEPALPGHWQCPLEGAREARRGWFIISASA